MGTTPHTDLQAILAKHNNPSFNLLSEMSLKMTLFLPLLALFLIVSDVEGGALRAVRCPGTAEVAGCEGGWCAVICGGGQVKDLQCETNNTYTKTRGKATLVICKTGVRQRV